LPRRQRERGNSLVLAMIVLSALGTLSMLTLMSVRSGMQTSSGDRFRATAMYAAESGAAAAMEYLRTRINPNNGWTTYLNTSPTDLPGNDAAVGDAANPFSPDLNAWYHVEILNNRNDGGYATNTDLDKRVVIRSTGYGPDNATAVIEWEIKSNTVSVAKPCGVYAQKGQGEDNSGQSDCLGTVDTGSTATF
jgi:hypothetical protein